MQKLQLPEYSFRIRKRDAGDLIFDEFRHRWVALTPEEWVRQHFLKYLSDEKKCPPSLMAVEKKVEINELQQRFDLLVYDRSGNPLMVANSRRPISPSPRQFLTRRFVIIPFYGPLLDLQWIQSFYLPNRLPESADFLPQGDSLV